MRSSLPATLEHIRVCEGGWSDDPKDPGGCTQHGITLRTWQDQGHPGATCASLRLITWADAAEIYTTIYWAGVRGDELPAGVDLLICDHGVNAGTGRALRLLQGVGYKPLAQADSQPIGVDFLARIAEARRDYYRSRPGFRYFGRGWLRRVDAAERAALLLIGVA